MTDDSAQPDIPDKSSGFFADMKRLLSFKLPWSERTTLEKAYTALFAAMLFALFPLPYEFYDSLRVLVCIGLYFFFQAILPERENRRGWFVLIIALFVLYNPVIPIRIGEQAIWTLLNAATIYALFRARLTLENGVKAEGPEL